MEASVAFLPRGCCLELDCKLCAMYLPMVKGAWSVVSRDVMPGGICRWQGATQAAFTYRSGPEPLMDGLTG